jgi:serine/threonine-protein kinase
MLPDVVGELIAGRYELEELIGSGGAASVFRAHDRLLERKVALKLLREEYTSDDDYVERFRHEARAAARLSHPNIVTVIDRGEADGRQFIVFEYVEGETLKELVEREGRLSVRDALELSLQIGRGLAFAHEQEVVHRDVKPQNVLLTDDGRAKVTDFGIARSVDVQAATTTTGAVLGTSDYISPEQASGGSVGAYTDVYSLGVLLYELLTGEVPYRGDSFVVTAMRHVRDPVPSILERRPDVPPRLDVAVRRAMAKAPADRFESMEAFTAELATCLAELDADAGATAILPPSGAAPLPPLAAKRRQRQLPALSLPLAIALVAAAALAAALVAIFTLHVGGVGRVGGGKTNAVRPPNVSLSGAKAYDPPPGDGSEHDDQAGKATDGDPSTYWYTQQYSTSDFGNLKSGVGLVLRAGRPVALKQIRVTSDTPGFTAVIKVGDAEGGPFVPDSSSQTVSAMTIFSLQGRSGRYYLLWITNLGAHSSVRVNEVRAQ